MDLGVAETWPLRFGMHGAFLYRKNSLFVKHCLHASVISSIYRERMSVDRPYTDLLWKKETIRGEDSSVLTPYDLAVFPGMS